MSRATKPRAAWSHSEGVYPTRVVAYEDLARRGMLTLRWWGVSRTGEPNWQRKSLGRVIATDRRGHITPECKAFAVGAAQRKSLELAGQLPAAQAARAPLTLGETEALVIDAKTGKYPHDSQFRRELVRAIRYAAQVWGPAKQWPLVTKADWTLLLRQRLEGLVARGATGVRATEVTVSRLHTVVTWLRSSVERIDETDARWPANWKEQIREHWRGLTHSTRDPEVSRPRHTEEEALSILTAATFDRRFELLMWLGMELRLGQVARARRTDCTLRDDGEWELLVHGAGKKGGVLVELTTGQKRVLTGALNAGGYLHERDLRYKAGEIRDYVLFPAGHRTGDGLPARNANWEVHVSRDWARENFVLAETLAGVTHVKGRAAYGVRRVAVDVGNAAGISLGGLQNLGGWADAKMPMDVYRDQANRAGMREAKVTRARLRGEPAE